MIVSSEKMHLWNNSLVMEKYIPEAEGESRAVSAAADVLTINQR